MLCNSDSVSECATVERFSSVVDTAKAVEIENNNG